jgi:hypothetical protein
MHKFILILLLFLPLVFIFDPKLPFPFHTPKYYVLIFIYIVIFSFFLIHLMSQRKANINIGVIDLLLLARFIWILIGYTELLSRHEIFELALIIIYFTSGFVLKNFNFSEYLAAFLLILLFSGFVQSAIGIYEHFLLRYRCKRPAAKVCDVRYHWQFKQPRSILHNISVGG